MFNRTSSLVPHNLNPSKAVNVRFCADIRDQYCSKLEQVIEMLASEGVKDIRLLLSSGGGGVERGIELYNTLRALSPNLTTHNIGIVDSITNVVFLAGKKRFATSNARFMMHGVSRVLRAGPDGNVSLEERTLKDCLRYVQRDHQRIAETVSRHTKMTESKIKKILSTRGDNIIMPKEATKLGLIDEIRDVESVDASNFININNYFDNQ
jgi:ATP-dependent Clp protease, protease subunit